MSESEISVSSLLGSIRNHVDERLKSPFVGAFVVSWVAHNWQEILVLTFSKKSIEEKISAVSASAANLGDVFWWPLFYAFVGILGYYLISAAFLIVFEFYGIIRRLIERKFDSYRWVHPNSYMEFKKISSGKIQELSDLASDKIEIIKDLQDQITQWENSNRDLSSNLSSEKARGDGVQKENEILKKEAAQTADTLLLVSKQLDLLKESSESIRTDFEKMSERQKAASRVLDSALMNAAKELDPENLGRLSSANFVAMAIASGKESETDEDSYRLLSTIANLRSKVIYELTA